MSNKNKLIFEEIASLLSYKLDWCCI